MEVSVTECRLQGKRKGACSAWEVRFAGKEARDQERAGVVSEPMSKSPELPLIE